MHPAECARENHRERTSPNNVRNSLGCICDLTFYSRDQPGDAKRTGLAEADLAEKKAVYDPRGYPPRVVGKRLAPRLERLDGKVIYLVDCLFENSDNFMEQMRQWFAAHLPAVVLRTIKPRESWVDDPEMRATIAREGQGAILGVGL